jgi:hypothetical protein
VGCFELGVLRVSAPRFIRSEDMELNPAQALEGLRRADIAYFHTTGDRTEAAQALDRAIKRTEIEAGNLGRRVGDRTDVEEKMLWKALLGQIELSKLTRDQVR